VCSFFYFPDGVGSEGVTDRRWTMEDGIVEVVNEEERS